MAYETIEPTLVPNTTMRKRINDTTGAIITYRIAPNDGFVLHDNRYDHYTDYDNEGNVVGDVQLGYTTGEVSCPPTYDFAVTTTVDGFTAYGDRKLFARPTTDVPENQIFGGNNDNDHEMI